MSEQLWDLHIEFEWLDQIEDSDAAELAAELSETGAIAETVSHHPVSGVLPIAAIVALIAVSSASAASIAVIVAFIYRVFRRGVVLDLTKDRPAIRKNSDLPRGSMLILHPDGRQIFHEGVASDAISELVKSAIGSKPPQGGNSKE